MQQSKRAVILVNLGTPTAPTASAVRTFLREFLSDRRVVDLTPWLWQPLLEGIILPLRCRRVADNYQRIWLATGSPLSVYSQQLAQDVECALRASGRPWPVRLAMTYGQPSLARVWDELAAQGVTEVLILPLYPQYSSTTTASVWDAWGRVQASRPQVPALQFVADYHAEPAYIAALAHSVRAHWQQHGQGHLLMSFHGIPERYAQQGDPYPQQCGQTASLLAQALELPANDWSMSFQSRFGREPWLQPYTDVTLGQLPAQGKRRVDVICPGFAADCLETLEEIAIGGAELFHAAGGETYHYIPALNAEPVQRDMLIQLITQRFAC